MDEVGKRHDLGMKYLFEMIGLYPAPGIDRYQRSGDGAGGFGCSGLRIKAPPNRVEACFVFGRSDPTVAGRT
jgi:hypothetical protein